MENTYGSFTDSLLNLKNSSDKAEFYGLSADVNLLPTTGIMSGSTAYCADNQKLYMFIASTSIWYLQNP